MSFCHLKYVFNSVISVILSSIELRGRDETKMFDVECRPVKFSQDYIIYIITVLSFQFNMFETF